MKSDLSDLIEKTLIIEHIGFKCKHTGSIAFQVFAVLSRSLNRSFIFEIYSKLVRNLFHIVTFLKAHFLHYIIN